MIVRILAGAVLLLALVLGWSLWRSEAAKRAEDKATARAVAAEGRAETLSEALARDGVSQGFTNTARKSMDAQAATTNERMGRLEARTHDRTPVSPVCPSPDPEFVRESAEGKGRIRAAERGLLDLRTPEG
jgi:imidazolonepropionase-like amidohydrolase